MRRNDGAPKLQYKKYTMLSDSQSHILATIERPGFLKFPRKTNQPMGKKWKPIINFIKHMGTTQIDAKN